MGKTVEIEEVDLVNTYNKSCEQVKAVLRGLFPAVLYEAVYEAGQYFYHKDSDSYYILAHAKENRTYQLINIVTGYSIKRNLSFYREGRDRAIRIPAIELGIKPCDNPFIQNLNEG